MKGDFRCLGYITYEKQLPIQKILFKTGQTKRVSHITKDGVTLAKAQLEPSLVDLLGTLDTYKITYTHVPVQDYIRPENKIKIPCNASCYYADERKDGHCNIVVKAAYENEYKGKGKKKQLLHSDIVVTFTARDVTELQKKSDCILQHIHFMTGIMGKPEEYEKTELC